MSGKIEFSHRPVLLDECLEGLAIKPDGIYVDGTAGGAGHSKEIAKRLKNGLLIAIDQDETAISVVKERLSEFGDRVRVVRSNFSEISCYLFINAICSCGNIEPNCAIKRERLLKFFSEHLCGCIGVGMRLKIGDTALG